MSEALRYVSLDCSNSKSALPRLVILSPVVGRRTSRDASDLSAANKAFHRRFAVLNGSQLHHESQT